MYEAFTRKYHPQGYDQGWWVGVIRRPGARRVTDICQHRHGSAESAQECAERLADLRNQKAGGEPHYAAAKRAGLLPDNQSRPPREVTAAEVEWLLGTDAPETIAERLGYRNLEALCVALSRAGRVDLVARLRDDTDSGRVPRGHLAFIR